MYKRGGKQMYMYILCLFIGNILLSKCIYYNTPIHMAIVINVGFNLIGVACLINENNDKMRNCKHTKP
jgi:hypothetical protein